MRRPRWWRPPTPTVVVRPMVDVQPPRRPGVVRWRGPLAIVRLNADAAPQAVERWRVAYEAANPDIVVRSTAHPLELKLWRREDAPRLVWHTTEDLL